MALASTHRQPVVDDEVPAPKGGWGELRAMAGFEGGLVVVGRGGLAWALDDSQSLDWRREDTGTEVDLTAISTRGLIAGGAGGVLVQRTRRSGDMKA